MRGITLSADEIDAAPPSVRRWLEQEIAGIAGWLMALEPAPCDSEDTIRRLIAARAYELWENEGHPSGRDLINWRQAEQEIMSRLHHGEKPA